MTPYAPPVCPRADKGIAPGQSCFGTVDSGRLRVFQHLPLSPYMRALIALLFSFVILLAPAQAASGGAQIPEPSNLALFGLGLTGLIIGRYAAKNRKGGGK